MTFTRMLVCFVACTFGPYVNTGDAASRGMATGESTTYFSTFSYISMRYLKICNTTTQLATNFTSLQLHTTIYYSLLLSASTYHCLVVTRPVHSVYPTSKGSNDVPEQVCGHSSTAAGHEAGLQLRWVWRDGNARVLHAFTWGVPAPFTCGVDLQEV